jgi:hypothetical protein
MTAPEDWELAPHLVFSPKDKNFEDHWLATTHNQDYDASGPTPLDAMTKLVIVLMRALDDRSS